VPAEVHQFAHDLFNQLTVINLCSFNLHLAVRDIVGPAITNDLQTLDRVVKDAMRLAERLSQAIVESPSHTEPKTPRLVKSPPRQQRLTVICREQVVAITETPQSRAAKQLIDEFK
jgi:hypothetical protein